MSYDSGSNYKYPKQENKTPVTGPGHIEVYDSSIDTLLHIKRVNELLLQFTVDLLYAAANHDSSKLKTPEKELFDHYTPLLKQLVYGSDAYKDSLEKLKPALEHHYANNSHHPEYYKNGIEGMNLFDIVEMFMDWKAAGERTKGGDMLKSIEINKDRFKMSDQLVSIFKNTYHSMNFDPQ